ncbi:hypothetical protein SPHINGOT1_80241 [Sphingomonas sp. T1]|nr:hypothetical protein SPHINGOT1_80241 [Sphingomonas sp. T1]
MPCILHYTAFNSGRRQIWAL